MGVVTGITRRIEFYRLSPRQVINEGVTRWHTFRRCISPNLAQLGVGAE